MMYWDYYGDYSWFGWFGHAIMMLFFWLLPIILIIAIVKNSGGKSARGNSAMEILKERYARGEIDKREFEKRKKDIA